MLQKISPNKKQEILKTLPSVRELLEGTDLVKNQIPYTMIIDLARLTLSEIRQTLTEDPATKILSLLEIIEKFSNKLNAASKPRLKNIINGTGIILHTGMGRAPFSKILIDRCMNRLAGYTNLELDMKDGSRGQRLSHVEDLISTLTGSESSVVVNNNAAAVLICLNTFADGKEALISRGQMVEIGGSFRIPDVIEKSGAVIREVGTTNRTHLADYEKNINKNTGIILTAHTSNYTIQGFTKTPGMDELTALSKKHNLPHVMDLGSGALVDMAKLNMPSEPHVRTYLKSKVDIVTFSGDKLLGGPQSGIICGRKSLVKKIKNNALYRALRCDKLTLIFLEESLKTYYTESSIHSSNLTWSLFTRKVEQVEEMGRQILAAVPDKIINISGVKLQTSQVEAGSGSLPTEKLNSMELLFQPKEVKPSELYRLFLRQNLPVVGYIHAKKYRIDLKAIPETQTQSVQESIIKVFS